LRVPLTHDHLSVVGALTSNGRLLTGVQQRAYRGADIVRFLRHLLRQIPGKLLVIWDGASIHRAHEVKEFLREEAGGRLHLEALPAYTPEANPVEGIWCYLKQVELRNLCCRTLERLRGELRKALARVRQRDWVFQSCIAHAGY
jgi:transposase